jgi:hypothetical protein
VRYVAVLLAETGRRYVINKRAMMPSCSMPALMRRTGGLRTVDVALVTAPVVMALVLNNKENYYELY